MNWPWNRGRVVRELEAARDAALSQARMAISARESAMAAGEAVAHRLAACDLERIETKAQFAKLAALARQLEEKLRDCESPPITSAELQKLTKRMAVLQTERDVLTTKCEKLEAKLEANEQRMVKVEQLALAQGAGSEDTAEAHAVKLVTNYG